VFVSLHGLIFGQETIDVADLTIKIPSGKEERLYYGFASGDVLIFNFKEVTGKELKEVEIIEYPASTKFQAYETATIDDKRITVNKSGIYQFRFNNTALMKERVCSIKIQRIPKSVETADFNTGVSWIERFDTTYSIKVEKYIAGYDTVQVDKLKKVLISNDTSIVTVTERVERVFNTTKLLDNDPSVSYINIELPLNTYTPNKIDPLKSSEVISWAYSISVGDNGKKWFEDANKKAGARTGVQAAVAAGLISTGAGAVGILALEGISMFSNPPQGDNVYYNFLTSSNGTTINLASGNSTAASGRITKMLQGSCILKLENDNSFDDINVSVQIVAVVINKTWKYESYKVQQINERKAERTLQVPQIKAMKVPVLSN
jgi:hypothetical protein